MCGIHSDYSVTPSQLTNITPLVDANCAYRDTHPVWSADGQSIIFESNRDGITTSLYEYVLPSAPAGGSNQMQSMSLQVQQGSSGAGQIVQQSGSPNSPVSINFPVQVYVDCDLGNDAIGRNEPAGTDVRHFEPGTPLTAYRQAPGGGLTWYRVSMETEEPIWVAVADPQGTTILRVLDPNNPQDCLLASTPTSTPSITPTATPYVTPTLYPTTTPGAPSTPPVTLCSDRQEQWIRDLCAKAWGYLDSTQQNNLTQLLPTIGTDFISLDTWWLGSVGRGIMDVPPQIWQYDSLQQCANYINRAGCEQIVHDSIYLFNNMGRIGVDWANYGGGHTISNNLTMQELWYLGEAPASYSQTYWGWVQGVDYACRTNRFGGNMAEVCWVCQDLPTLLYERLQYSLSDQMSPVTSYFNEAYYRSVPAVVYFANWLAANQGGNPVLSGSNAEYRIGANVFTSIRQFPSLPSLSFPAEYADFNHVGIVVRGAEPSMSLADALDYVLVAQISYSSQGFFSSSSLSTDSELNIAPNGYAGRYEVITLRTYLLKHIGGSDNIVQTDPTLNSEAGLYLRHWAPADLLLNYDN